MSGYRSSAFEAFAERRARERDEVTAREAKLRRPITDEEAAALTVSDWSSMSFERRNRLFQDQQGHYERLRDESMR